MKPLYKTTVVFWSEYHPADNSVEIDDLARDAMTGESYCSMSKTELVEDPALDPDWDGTEFFDSEESESVSAAFNKRGVDAACSFIERIGMELVERDAYGFDLVAMDKLEYVFIDVITRRPSVSGTPLEVPYDEATVQACMKQFININQIALDMSCRYDVIELVVIAEDRALLRHHRDYHPGIEED